MQCVCAVCGVCVCVCVCVEKKKGVGRRGCGMRFIYFLGGWQELEDALLLDDVASPSLILTELFTTLLNGIVDKPIT